MVLAVVIKVWWEKVRYFVLNVAYGFPFVGRVARASRKPQTIDGSHDDVLWYASERMLCADFYPHYDNFAERCDPEFFEKCEDYLNKTGQLGRKEKGMLMWIATFALVIFEAVGFAYVLAPFMARNVSANAAGMLAWMIAFMLSIILVPLTDKMGQQLHKNSLLNKIRVWHADARKSGHAKKLEPNTHIKIATTDEDDDEPNYIKILNRVDCGARPTAGWKISAFTVLMITAIAIGAYVIRSHTIAGLETEEVNASPFTALSTDAGNGASPFDLPGAAKHDDAKADKRAAGEEVHSKIVAYKTTFVILSVIFIGVQVFGILVGFFYSIAGEESKKAAKYIHGFNNAKEFVNHYRQLRDRVSRDAQAKLGALQQMVEERHDTSGDGDLRNMPRGTFIRYVEEEQEREARAEVRRHNVRTNADASPGPVASARTVAASPAPMEPPAEVPGHHTLEPAMEVAQQVAQPVPVPAPAPAPAPAAAHEAPVGDASAALIAGLGDLTQWSDAELADMASGLGVPLDALQRRQALQRKIAQARAARTPEA
jgi:hypothetical protein